MENVSFAKQNQLFKANKLKRVICSKIADVSEDNLTKILSFVNIDKQYFVKATRNPKKFLNTITEENVCLADKHFNSNSQVIYGACTPGRFENVRGERCSTDGWVDEDVPAAAVKTIVNIHDEHPGSTEYLLIIYEPKNKNGCGRIAL